MIADLHVHTVFSDGADTPEDMVRAAIARGIDVLGFSEHAYTSFDGSYCMKPEDVPRYKQTIAELKRRYEGQIRILCGIEQDLYSDEPAEGFDYVIGSVHYVRVNGAYYSIDHTPSETRRTVETAFGGDFCSFARAYYENEARVIRELRPDIVGHFDLIEKFRDTDPLLAPAGREYESLWRDAADVLLPFEINTGAISRGYRKTPYLYGDKLAFLLAHGARVLLSSDAHSKETLLYAFDTFSSLVPPEQKGLSFLPFL